MDRKELKRRLREGLVQAGLPERANAAQVAAMLGQLLDSGFRHYGDSLSPNERHALLQEVTWDVVGWGPLQPLMDSPEVTEIMVNGPERVIIERRGAKELTNVAFDSESHLRAIVSRMIAPSGRRIDEMSPYVDFSLPDGSRVNVVVPPVGHGGPHVTIRKFLSTISSLDELVRRETIDSRMAIFLSACVGGRMNMLFCGATGSGKTTTLEVLSAYIPDNERIIVIEDTVELSFRQTNVVRLLTRAPNVEGRGEVTARDLFINTLRMRPSRIILGEIRGGEALEYLQTLASGHGGSLAVMHAASPEDATLRLETMALYSGLNVPVSALRAQLARGLHIIVQQSQLGDGARKVTRVSEVMGLGADGEIELHDVYRFVEAGVGQDGRVEGVFTASGSLPTCYDALARRGFELPTQIFSN